MKSKEFILLGRLLDAIGNNTITEKDLDALLASKSPEATEEPVEIIDEPPAELDTPETTPLEKPAVDDEMNMEITESRVSITSFSDSPDILAKVGDSNIIYVNLCESVPNYCGTAKIQFMGKELFMNSCDMNGEKTINLDIEINGQMMYSTPFIVKENSQENSLQINKVLLCQQNPPST